MNPIIEPYGVVAAVVAIILIILTILQYAQRKIKFRALLFWEILWVILFMTGIFPETYRFAVTYLGMASPIHFVTTFSIIFLFIFTFFVYQKISDLNKKIVEIVQYLAVLESKSRKGRK